MKMKWVFMTSFVLWLAFINGNAQQVTVNGNVFKFPTLADYEGFAENETLQASLVTMAGGSASLTTVAEANGGQEDTLYGDFLSHALNDEHIMEVGSFYLKVDVANSRGLAILTTEPNAYQSIQGNVLTATNMFEFTMDEDNAVEVLEAVEAGQVTAATYQDYLTTLRSCLGATRQKAESFEIWDEKIDRAFGCNDNKALYGKDCKVVYQKFIFWFSLQSKIKSLKGCTYTNWFLVPGYNAALKLSAKGVYRRRCGSEVVIRETRSTTDNVLNYRPYTGSRSLSHYVFHVDFQISHPAVTTPTPHSTPLSIKSGY